MLRFLLPLSLSVAAPATAQQVPEGIHSDARGPSTMCGLTGADVSDLMRQVRASPALAPTPSGSARFDLYVSSDNLATWVFTKPGEPAHPAVTCRQLHQENDGSWVQSRRMRCGAGRAACDRLFIEFQELDEQLSQELSN